MSCNALVSNVAHQIMYPGKIARCAVYTGVILSAIAAIVGLGALLAHTNAISSSFLVSLVPNAAVAAVWTLSTVAAATLLTVYGCVAAKPPRNDTLETNSPIGGVENVGVTCYISITLQQLAAESELFPAVWNTPLDRAVQKIRSGRTVTRDEVRDVHAYLMRALKWPDPINRTGDPVEHITTILQSRGRHDVRNYEKMEMQKITIGDDQYRLERGRPKEDSPLLTAVWEFRGSFGGILHLVIYKKIEGKWFCCNDNRLTKVASYPTDERIRMWGFYTIPQPELDASSESVE